MGKESTDGPARAWPVRKPGAPVGEHLRGAAVAAVLQEGMSIAAAARRFGLAKSSLGHWVKRFRERGHVRADPMGGRPSRIEPARERIFRILEARPAISSRGLRDALAAEGLEFGAATVQRFLKRYGLQREIRLARLRRRRKGVIRSG